MTVQRKWTDASWRALWIAASAAVAVLIFLFSAQTAPESNETSKSVLYWLLSLLRLTPRQMEVLTNHFIRKAAHFTVYALLGFCLTGLYHHQSRIPKAPAAIVTAALYAVTDELHQSFVPGRGPMLTDVLLDIGGAALRSRHDAPAARSVPAARVTKLHTVLRRVGGISAPGAAYFVWKTR